MCKASGILRDNATLIHVDSHLDDLFPSQHILERLSQINSIEQSVALGDEMQHAEFILPAVFRGIFSTVAFVCPEHEFLRLGNPDYQNTSEFQEQMGGREHTVIPLIEVEQLLENEHLKLQQEHSDFVLDLDLDYFNRGTVSLSDPVLLEDSRVRRYLRQLRQYASWKGVMIALEPEYCGGWEACTHFFEMFIEEFELNFEDFIAW